MILSARKSMKRYKEYIYISENFFTNRKVGLEEDNVSGPVIFKKLFNTNLLNETIKLSAVLELCDT